MIYRPVCLCLCWLVMISEAFAPVSLIARTTTAHSPLSMAPINEGIFDSSTLVSWGTGGTIDWNDPVEAVVGAITLLYIGFSLWAGAKYVIKDGWRPPKQ